MPGFQDDKITADDKIDNHASRDGATKGLKEFRGDGVYLFTSLDLNAT